MLTFRLNLVGVVHWDQGLKGYSRDPGFDQNTVPAGIGKTINILTGYGIWMLPGKRDSPKFGHGMREFFRLFVENLGNRHDPNKRPSSQSRWCLLSNFHHNEVHKAISFLQKLFKNTRKFKISVERANL